MLQVNPQIKFETFIHKVDGLSDDHKIETQRDISKRVNEELHDAGLVDLHLRYRFKFTVLHSMPSVTYTSDRFAIKMIQINVYY